MFNIKSAAFEHGQPIPKKYTKEGEDLSPPLSWSDAPDGVKEFALICDDPDAPRSDPWVHWVVYHIPPDRDSLPENDAGGATEGQNDFQETGYGGPMPPPGHGTHHYHFKLYALNEPVQLDANASKEDLLSAMKEKIIEQCELVGLYER